MEPLSTPLKETAHFHPKKKRKISELSQEEIADIISLRGKMPQSAIGKRYGIDQTDVSQIQRLQKGRLNKVVEDKRRVRDVELVVPIVYGTVAFWLGKKADQSHSHKWTVYVRCANNSDLSCIVKRVIFTLHHSFDNPTRVVDQPPFQLTETGWGEFEIGITLWLHSDAADKPIELLHGLKLHQDREGGVQSTKKAVVSEKYDEIVFTEPSEALCQRLSQNPAVQFYGSSEALSAVAAAPPVAEPCPSVVNYENGDTRNHPLLQWFGKYSDADELQKLVAARQQVATRITDLNREYALLEGECQKLTNG